MNKILMEVLDWTKSIAIVFVITILINVFIFEPYTVSGDSMLPNFHGANDYIEPKATADRIILLKLPSLFNAKPSYEDVVIIDSRVTRTRTLKDEFIDNAIISRIIGRSNENFYIKRVIGLPGDTLEYRDGKVYRNGELLEEDYILEEMSVPFETITVPEDHVYVMGDNRNFSKDSRSLGPIPLENVRGEVMVRIYPFNRISVSF